MPKFMSAAVFLAGGLALAVPPPVPTVVGVLLEEDGAKPKFMPLGVGTEGRWGGEQLESRRDYLLQQRYSAVGLPAVTFVPKRADTTNIIDQAIFALTGKVEGNVPVADVVLCSNVRDCPLPKSVELPNFISGLEAHVRRVANKSSPDAGRRSRGAKGLETLEWQPEDKQVALLLDYLKELAQLPDDSPRVFARQLAADHLRMAKLPEAFLEQLRNAPAKVAEKDRQRFVAMGKRVAAEVERLFPADAAPAYLQAELRTALPMQLGPHRTGYWVRFVIPTNLAAVEMMDPAIALPQNSILFQGVVEQTQAGALKVLWGEVEDRFYVWREPLAICDFDQHGESEVVLEESAHEYHGYFLLWNETEDTYGRFGVSGSL
jgi:hypothetical protein